MNAPDIRKKRKDLHVSVNKGELCESINILRQLAQGSAANLEAELDEVSYSYSTMLDFYKTGVKDPQMMNVYWHLMEKLHNLVDDWAESELYVASPTQLRNSARVQSPDTQLQRLVSAYMAEAETGNPMVLNDMAKEMFNVVWSNTPDTAVVGVVRDFVCDDSISVNHRMLVVGSVVFSLAHRFSAGYMSLLVELCSNQNPSLRSRALVGTMLFIMLYQQRIGHCPQLKSQIDTLSEQPSMRGLLMIAILSVIKSYQTELITDAVNNEIAPSLINAKLVSDKSNGKSMEELLQPDWTELIDEEPKLKKSIETFARWQNEGADVLLSTFRHLKDYGFFKELSNWLMPFDDKNPQVEQSLESIPQEVRSRFISMIYDSALMCDSDKYSILLSFNFIPQNHRAVICDAYSAELEQTNERNDGISLSPDLPMRHKIDQFVHDLYRLFYIHPHKNEFPNIMSVNNDFFGSSLFSEIFDATDRESIADYSVEHGQYFIAKMIFDKLPDASANVELHKKSAYCLIKMSRYSEALEHLKMAEMLGDNKKWTKKKMAACYHGLGQYENELSCLKHLQSSCPDDLKYKMAITQCYENLHLPQEALKVLYEIDYKMPSDNVTRSIVKNECYLRKFDSAAGHACKIIDKNKDDMASEGMIYACLGRIDDAVAVLVQLATLCSNESDFRLSYINALETLQITDRSKVDLAIVRDVVVNSVFVQK